VLVGHATRLAQFLDKDAKEYVAQVRFGFETDTGDRTGNQTSEVRFQHERLAERLAATDWEAIFSHFRGDLLQTPPMYSAKKIDGRKLYELARKGETVERRPVHVHVSELDLWPDESSDSRPAIRDHSLRIRVRCSAGTYVRTLAEDIGRRIGVGAHLTMLRRTASGKFGIADAVTLDELAQHPQPDTLLQPVEKAVGHLPEFRLPADRVVATRNGLSTRLRDAAPYTDGETVRMTDPGGKLLAVGRYDAAENSVQPKIVLV
jgi:tRNA pseudouridine55 synthase